MEMSEQNNPTLIKHTVACNGLVNICFCSSRLFEEQLKVNTPSFLELCLLRQLMHVITHTLSLSGFVLYEVQPLKFTHPLLHSIVCAGRNNSQCVLHISGLSYYFFIQITGLTLVDF